MRGAPQSDDFGHVGGLVERQPEDRQEKGDGQGLHVEMEERRSERYAQLNVRGGGSL